MSWRYWLKYEVFKRPYNERDIKQLMQYADAQMSEVDVEKLIFLSNTRTKKQIKELMWIFKKMKGGMKNNE